MPWQWERTFRAIISCARGVANGVNERQKNSSPEKNSICSCRRDKKEKKNEDRNGEKSCRNEKPYARKTHNADVTQFSKTSSKRWSLAPLDSSSSSMQIRRDPDDTWSIDRMNACTRRSLQFSVATTRRVVNINISGNRMAERTNERCHDKGMRVICNRIETRERRQLLFLRVTEPTSLTITRLLYLYTERKNDNSKGEKEREAW